MKPFFVLTNNMHIGGGCFGDVYRLPDGHVVKIMYSGVPGDRDNDYELMREIEGSFNPDALPILDLVRVIMPNGKERYGLLKCYLPLKVGHTKYREHWRSLVENNPTLKWDLKANNLRMDIDRRVWIIDTAISTRGASKYTKELRNC